MLPQFVSLGPLTLNLYTFLIALAALASLSWAWFKTRDERIFTVALVTALFALAFGRAGYVALNWDYLREHTNEILSLAGLSEHGAIVGGFIAYFVLRIAHRALPNLSIFNFQFSILNSASFILIAIAASLGCIPNGCAHGREVFWQTDGKYSLAWLLHADWPDAYSISSPRWPTQVFMALWLALTSALIGMKAWTSRNMLLLLLSLPLLIASFATGDFLFQYLRGDPAPTLAGLRVYQWLDLVLLALVGVLLILGARRMR